MRKIGVKSLLLSSCCLLVGVGFGLTALSADGDPNDHYDFSGKAWPSEFVEQMKTSEYRFGKWTIQSVLHVEPFGYTWEPETSVHMNIFYGTRPLERIGGFVDSPDKDENWGETISQPWGAYTLDSLYDFTGTGDPCFVIRRHSYTGSPSIHDLEVYRLKESRDPENPAASEVVRLADVQADSVPAVFDDFDGDARPEIYTIQGYGGTGSIATAGILSGFFPRLLTWSKEADAYVQADPTLLANRRVDGGRRTFHEREERVALLKKENEAERDRWIKAFAEAQAGKPIDVAEFFSDALGWAYLNQPELAAEVFEVAKGRKFTVDHIDELDASALWNKIMASVPENAETFKRWSPRMALVKLGKDDTDTRPWANLLAE